MTIRWERVTVTVAGSDGSAAGSAKSSPFTGRLLATHIDYTTQPATADVTLATTGSDVPAQTLLTVTNNATDGWYYPRRVTHDAAGAPLTYDGTRQVMEAAVVSDSITVSVAQGNAGAVAVLLMIED